MPAPAPIRSLAVAAMIVAAPVAATPGLAASEPFLGEIVIFPYNFCPVGWLEANGQLLPISQNTALFSLIGTLYGGNGTTQFALPNVTAAFTTTTTVGGNTVVAPLAMKACIATQGTFPPRPD